MAGLKSPSFALLCGCLSAIARSQEHTDAMRNDEQAPNRQDGLPLLEPQDADGIPAHVAEAICPGFVEHDIYTCSRDGNILTVNFTGGTQKGEILRLDIDEVWRRQQAEKQFPHSNDEIESMREEPSEEDLPSYSYHGPDGRLLSEDECERVTALEMYHEEQGTLHLLYPEQFQQGYSYPSDYYDDDEELAGEAADVTEEHSR